jgi:NAD(P)-dependent dehydrogenase (short-subunit alcohol dehydrogenase family)
MNLLNQIINKV